MKVKWPNAADKASNAVRSIPQTNSGLSCMICNHTIHYHETSQCDNGQRTDEKNYATKSVDAEHDKYFFIWELSSNKTSTEEHYYYCCKCVQQLKDQETREKGGKKKKRNRGRVINLKTKKTLQFSDLKESKVEKM